MGLMASSWLGYFCGVLWYLGNCYWIYQTMYLYGGLPKPVALAILVLFSLYLGLYQALFAWTFAYIRRSWGSTAAVGLAPFLWVGVELARAKVTGFPWDLLGYTQVDNPLMTRLAPVGGVMLLSFVVAAVSALFVLAWGSRGAGRRALFVAVVAVFALALQLGSLRSPAPDRAEHYATLLQENLLVGAVGRDVVSLSYEEKYRQFIALSKVPLAEGTATTGAEKPDMIVWPEAPSDFATADPVFQARLSRFAAESAAPVIVGSIGVDFDRNEERGYREFGSAAVFGADGGYMGRYDKIHRVPWGEYVPYKHLFFFAGKLISGVGNMDAGTQHTVFDLGGHKVGIFICYESIFGDEVREFAKNGADVLVNISDDGWYGDTGAPWQHLDMERMRAIENDRWILRDTNTGVTTSVDPHGRGIFSTPRHVRQAFSLPFDYISGTTFYTRHGDWFAWLCALVSMGMLGWVRLRGREVH